MSGLSAATLDEPFDPLIDLDGLWTPELAERYLPIEFVSPSSRRRDRIDKPKLAAAAGIPYYLRVEIPDQLDSPELHLFELTDGAYRSITSAVMGEQFDMKRPFEVSFDPQELLEP